MNVQVTFKPNALDHLARRETVALKSAGNENFCHKLSGGTDFEAVNFCADSRVMDLSPALVGMLVFFHPIYFIFERTTLFCINQQLKETL